MLFNISYLTIKSSLPVITPVNAVKIIYIELHIIYWHLRFIILLLSLLHVKCRVINRHYLGFNDSLTNVTLVIISGKFVILVIIVQSLTTNQVLLSSNAVRERLTHYSLLQYCTPL